MKLVTASVMRELDRTTIEEIGIPGVVLMENAGRGAVEVIRAHFPDRVREGAQILLFCGKGNNGGDGFVIGRHLHNRGCRVRFLLFSPVEKVTGDARTNLEAARKMGLSIVEVTDRETLRKEEDAVAGADLLIDALLGTGLTSELRDLYRAAVETMNQSATPVVAVDVPSGLHTETGRPLGAAVQADLTVTFGLPKVGEVVYPGAGYTGRLVTVDIGIPRERIEGVQTPYTLLEGSDLAPHLQKRPPDSHKGTFGHLLIVAGSEGMTGAAALAGEAAMRAGSGLVSVAVPRSLREIIEMKLTECLKIGLEESEPGVLGEGAVRQLTPHLHRCRATLLGPGLSTRGEVPRVVVELIERAEHPMVIDADALNVLAGTLESLDVAKAPLILTPHPGEMGRLLRSSAARVQENRLSVARDFATRHGVILVLKGARTLIATPEGEVFVNPTGNAGMASGGTGDVLAGMIGGFLVQGHPPCTAALLGVYLHGLAGDLAAEALGERSFLASDLLDRLPAAIAQTAVSSPLRGPSGREGVRT
ncbi:MAG: NAD(P)H-hydrate dehydratase [Deltaproteobacteria bacterium]|nr:MAG: NAD(P)H-hydrate dehydratase [Deltaproteobacteria bacterium]